MRIALVPDGKYLTPMRAGDHCEGGMSGSGSMAGHIFDFPGVGVPTGFGFLNFGVIDPLCFHFPAGRELKNEAGAADGDSVLEIPCVVEDIGALFLDDS